MKKYSFEQAKEKLLSYGFKPIENTPEEGIITLGTFGLNYCSCCKRADAIVSIFKQEEDDVLEYQIITEMFSGNDFLSASSLTYEIRELGIKKIKKPKTDYPEMVNYGEEGLEDSQEL